MDTTPLITRSIPSSGEALPIARTADLLVRSDVDLALRGPWTALELSGRLELCDARWERRLEVARLPELLRGSGARGGLDLAGVREEPWSSTRLDVEVRTREAFRVVTPPVRTDARTALPLGVPIEVDAGTGAHWLEAH